MPDPAPDATDRAIATHATALERCIRAAVKEAGLPAPKPEYIRDFLEHSLLQKAVALGEAAKDTSRASAAVQLGDRHLLTTLAYVKGATDFFVGLTAAAKGKKSPLATDVQKALGKLIEKHQRATV